ncbi:ribokinase [Nakamurella sp. YIM 132087]|uniref:Ribokinase n=2 Tax=Nakamurella alba TaxID=2665158 RepID=A0A7K1FF24_9ACTN|nr:ribokinase [Nakamurella alba]
MNMDLVGTVAHFPAPGETILGREFRTVPGGKGANQAIAAARAGGDVQFVGALGTDPFGDTLAAHLAAEGVGRDGLDRVDGVSGIALITVADGGENTIVVVPGANGTLADLNPVQQQLIRDADVLVCQLEIPMAGVTRGAGIAAAAGVPVLLNASPVTALPDELIDAVTVAIVNEGEAADLGDAVLQRIPHLVTTLGAAGARYRGPEGTTAAVGAPAVNAVDTTGAGDAFTGALAVAWSRGLPPAEALEYACAAGALATTVFGAGVSAPTESAIRELLAG